MKYLMILFLSFLVTSPFFGQKEVVKFDKVALDSIIEKRYEGGIKIFLETIYKKIQYPKAARSSCRVGKIIVQVDVNKEGKLAKIEFLNKIKVGKGLEKEVINSLIHTANNWKTGDTTHSFTLSFVFWIGNKKRPKGDVNVVASDFQKGNCVRAKSVLFKKMKKLEKKQQYEKALVLCRTLLQRYPMNVELLGKYDLYLKNTAK